MKTAKWLVSGTLKMIEARFKPATAGLLSVLLMFSLVSPSISIARSEKEKTDSYRAYDESKSKDDDSQKTENNAEKDRDGHDVDNGDDQATHVDTDTPKNEETDNATDEKREEKRDEPRKEQSDGKQDNQLPRADQENNTGGDKNNTVIRTIETNTVNTVRTKTRGTAPEQTGKTGDTGGNQNEKQTATAESEHQINGAVWTSDVNGNVNLNHYNSKPEVYLNGGPRRGTSNGLTDGEYHWRITDPNGNIVLGSSGGRTFTVTGGRMDRFSLWHWNPPASHYADTPNNGGVYKVIISRNPDFPSNETKSDSFKVYRPAPEPPTVNGLSIDKTDEKDPVALGESINYQIAVTNKGDTTQTGVTVTDTLPDGLFYVSSLPAPLPPATGPVLVWSVGTLGPDQTAFIDVTVGANRADIFINRAQARSDQVEDVTDDEDTRVLEPEDEDENLLRIVKSDPGSDPVNVGDNITYKIAVTNTGNKTLKEVKVEDALPTGLSFVSSEPNAASVNPLYWTLEQLDAGETEEIRVVVGTSEPGVFRNVAVASHKDTDPATDDETTTVNPPSVIAANHRLGITKIDTVDPVELGGNTDYIIKVTNTGDTTLTKVKLADALPGGFDFVSTSVAPESMSGGPSWDLGTMAPGEVREVRITAKGKKVGTHINTAEATAKELGDKVTADQPTRVVAPPVVAPATYDLSIEKTDDVDPAVIGDTVTYTITVKNTGDQPLTGLDLRDSLPAGMEFKGSSTGIERLNSNGVYGWSIDVLEPGEIRNFVMTTKAKEAGTWTNTVTITADELPTAKEAIEQTRVLPATIQASQITNRNTGGSLPFTGFPLTIWLLTSLTVITGGLWLELSARRRRGLAQTK